MAQEEKGARQRRLQVDRDLDRRRRWQDRTAFGRQGIWGGALAATAASLEGVQPLGRRTAVVATRRGRVARTRTNEQRCQDEGEAHARGHARPQYTTHDLIMWAHLPRVKRKPVKTRKRAGGS